MTALVLFLFAKCQKEPYQEQIRMDMLNHGKNIQSSEVHQNAQIIHFHFSILHFSLSVHKLLEPFVLQLFTLRGSYKFDLTVSITYVKQYVFKFYKTVV